MPCRTWKYPALGLHRQQSPATRRGKAHSLTKGPSETWSQRRLTYLAAKLEQKRALRS